MHSSSIPRPIEEILYPSHHASFRVPVVMPFGSGSWSRSKSLAGHSTCFVSTTIRAGKHAHRRWLVVSIMTPSSNASSPSIHRYLLPLRTLEISMQGTEISIQIHRDLGFSVQSTGQAADWNRANSSSSIARKDARRSAPCGRREARWIEERMQGPPDVVEVRKNAVENDPGRPPSASVGRGGGRSDGRARTRRRTRVEPLARRTDGWEGKRTTEGSVRGSMAAEWRTQESQLTVGTATTPATKYRWNTNRDATTHRRRRSAWNGTHAWPCETIACGRKLSVENARLWRRWLASSSDRK